MFLEHCTAAWIRSVFVISVNVAFDPVAGNLRNHEKDSQLVALADQGKIHAVVAGPPCETWSVARGCPGGPAVLRDTLAIWGKVWCKQKEWQQLAAANELLQSTLLLVLDMVRNCGFAIVEHPAWWKREVSIASIWHMTCIRAIVAAPCCSLVDLSV